MKKMFLEMMGISQLSMKLVFLHRIKKTWKTKKLIQKQNEVSRVMKAVKDSVEPAKGSIAEMRKELSDLTKQWTETGDATERKNIGKRILELTKSLKNAEEGIGNFKRNVGNYAESITTALGNIGNISKASFSTMASSAGATIQIIKGLDLALKTLATNPIALAIAAVVFVIKQLIDAFGRSESATGTLNKAMANLEPILIIIQRAFDKIVDVVADVILKFTEFINYGLRNLDKIGKVFGQDWGLAEAFEEITNSTQKIADAENELIKLQREYDEEVSKTNLKISEQETILRDKSKSAAEREKANNEIQKLRLALVDKEIALRQKELDKYNNYKSIEQFKINFYNAINDQVETIKQQYKSYGEINPEYEGEDIIVKADVEKQLPDESIPIINFYFDVSGSWTSHPDTIEIGKQAVATVKEFKDRGECELNVYYFGNTSFDVAFSPFPVAYINILSVLYCKSFAYFIIFCSINCAKYY